MQFTATLESAGRVHLSASGGSDKSGWVAPMYFGAWRVYSVPASKDPLTQFTASYLVFASLDMLKEVNLEGLLQNTSYEIELISQDICGNTGAFRRAITAPSASPELSAPVLSEPTTQQIGFLNTSVKTINFTATDDTGLKRVGVYIDGSLVQEFNYFNGISFRWWTNFFPQDNYLSTLEGPHYFVVVPDAYKGVYGWVEVVIDDPAGNQTRRGAYLGL